MNRKRPLALFAAATLAGGCAASPDPQLTFVQMTDSQFGFYDYEAELNRYRQAVELINADGENAAPNFMIMCGDMVNVPNEKNNADFVKASEALDIPYYLVPGNHDYNAKREIIDLYHKSFGRDYYTFDRGRYRIIVTNTNLWKSPQAETAEFDRWFSEALQNAKDDGKLIIVAGHCPIFLKTADEPDDQYYNLPRAKRAEILKLFKDYSVVAYLGGHSHTRIDNTWEGIRFLHPENTCTNFDNRPFGYRLIFVQGRTVYDSFVPLKR
ncbi:MAG: metallophosphoesterase [Victivallaceae bacterium]|nr:metallophosphoesterase [Victivallaceae bacterium]